MNQTSKENIMTSDASCSNIVISKNEKGKWMPHFTITKYEDGQLINSVEFDGNMLVNTGINLMLTLLAGGAGTAFNNANSYIGVGDSTTAAAASQTDLQAATNKLRKAMNATYPTYGTSQQIKFQSTFATSEANFDWNEIGIFNASTAGTMLNRKVEVMGTKLNTQQWTAEVTITVS